MCAAGSLAPLDRLGNQDQAPLLKSMVPVGVLHEQPCRVLSVLADHRNARPAVTVDDLLHAGRIASVKLQHPGDRWGQRVLCGLRNNPLVLPRRLDELLAGPLVFSHALQQLLPQLFIFGGKDASFR